MEVSGQLQTLAALTPEERGRVDPIAGLDDMDK
jgi:hypothetical protein